MSRNQFTDAKRVLDELIEAAERVGLKVRRETHYARDRVSRARRRLPVCATRIW